MPKLTVRVPLVVSGMPGRLQAAMDDLAQHNGQRKMTQQQFAALTGMSQSSASRYLKKKRLAGGSVGHTVLIAEALGVRVGWFIGNEPPMRSPGAPIPTLPLSEAIDADEQNAPNVPVRAKHGKK